ncbi:hypothetical protein TNCV_2991891 [Trichonephila clavipes]|nr:hypothetical protein TNCV_2991891 [Trichonephila clavipes]
MLRDHIAGSLYSSYSWRDNKGSELANMVTKDVKMVAKVAKLATNLVAENDANLALPPRFRQVLIEYAL